jgi:hypothetical protein
MAGCVLAVLGAPLFAADQLITDFEKDAPGPTNAGQPLSPPAPGWTLRGPSGWAARMTVATEENTTPPNHYLRLDYDFTGGNQDGTPIAGAKYLIAACHLPLPAGTTSLSWRVRGDGARHALVVSVVDATGQWFNFGAANTDWQGWRTLTAGLTSGFHSHGGGANDGVMHQPLALYSFNLTDNPKSPQQGSLGFDDLRAQYSEGPDFVKMDYGGVARQLRTGAGPQEVLLTLTSSSDQPLRGTVSYTVGFLPVAGVQVPSTTSARDFACPPHGHVDIPVRFAAPQYGLYRLQGQLTVQGSDRAADLATTYAVLPPPRLDPHGLFGLDIAYQRDLLDGAYPQRLRALRALGASWTVAVLSWQKIQPTAGAPFQWAEHDQALAGPLPEGLSLFAMLGHMPAWVKLPGSGASADQIAAARTALEGAYLPLLEAAARRYDSVVSAWGLAHLVKTNCYADAQGDAALADFFRRARAVVHGVDPRTAVVPDVGDWYPPPQAWHAADYDALSSEVLWKSEPYDQQAGVRKERARLPGLSPDQRLWFLIPATSWPRQHEQGQPQPATPATELRDAADLARMLVTAHAGNDRDHVQWDRLQYGPSAVGDPDLGLLRADGSPKPAACAFATACDLLAGSRLVRDDSDAAARRLVFSTPDGKQVQAAWKLGAAPASLDLADPAATEIVSLLGTRRPAGPGHEKATLALTDEPVYVITPAPR